jgi:3-oxoadipate enol-lactonase
MYYAEDNDKVSVNDLTVSYIDEGITNPATIIFIHGFPLNKSMWEKQIKQFKEDYRVIAYDIRGHGNTDVGNDNFSIDFFVYDLISMMNALGIGKAILCGFSMGGYIALRAIEKHPERFSALLLCDTNCAADSPETKVKRLKTIEFIRENGLEQYAEDSLEKLFAPISFSNHIKEMDDVREMILKTSIQTLYKTLHALAERSETCTSLHNINIPVLILVGKNDVITPPELALKMHKKIQGSVMHIINRAGHVSNMENPKEFNDYLAEFLLLIKTKQH